MYSFFKNFTIKVLSQHCLLVTARVDFLGKVMGKECMICMVGMKWWLIPSGNHDYNDTLFARYMLFVFKQNMHNFSRINFVNIKGKSEEGNGKVVLDTTRKTPQDRTMAKKAHVKPWPLSIFMRETLL